MSCQFIALYYEDDVVQWLEDRFPTIEVFIVIRVDQTTYHALVSPRDADTIKGHLCKDLVPPFTRRVIEISDACQPKYEPGILFQFDDFRQSSKTLTRTAVAYRLAITKLSDPSHQKYVQGKLAQLDAKISESGGRTHTRSTAH